MISNLDIMLVSVPLSGDSTTFTYWYIAVMLQSVMTVLHSVTDAFEVSADAFEVNVPVSD